MKLIIKISISLNTFIKYNQIYLIHSLSDKSNPTYKILSDFFFLLQETRVTKGEHMLVLKTCLIKQIFRWNAIVIDAEYHKETKTLLVVL